jgi:hypothetical protein
MVLLLPHLVCGGSPSQVSEAAGHAPVVPRTPTPPFVTVPNGHATIALEH